MCVFYQAAMYMSCSQVFKKKKAIALRNYVLWDTQIGKDLILL